MTREAVVFGISGTAFGLLVGWIIGSQQGTTRPIQTTAATTQSSPAVPGAQPAPPPLDLQRVAALEQAAKARPSDALARTELGNLYQDAQRPDLAIPWYEAAFKLSPKDVNVSTDLAVCYYYTEQPDKALAQIDRSLAIDPKHPATLLNQGIIRAFGKQDFVGALESWDKVIAVAPDGPEAGKARLLKSAHGSGTPAPGGAGRGGL